MALKTTMGSLLVNEALPEEYRDYARVLDKKGLNELLRRIAAESPDDYRRISKRLADIGRDSATRSGGNSFGLAHLSKAKAGRAVQDKLQAQIDRILDDDNLDSAKRRELIVRKVGDAMQGQMDDVYNESLADDNPLARQVLSGSRGNKMNLSSLRGSDMLYSDQHDNVIPVPVLRSYSQGLTPAEYWAGTYGARRGVLATKFATRDAGYLCLAEGTLVRMADGSTKAIEQIAVGDVVLGADKDGEGTFPTAVTATFDNGYKECVTYKFDASLEDEPIYHEVCCTPAHRFLTWHGKKAIGFDHAKPFLTPKVSVRLVVDCDDLSSGYYIRSAKVWQAYKVGHRHVYDIEVEHKDHLFVLANGLITSNSKQLNQLAHRLVVTDQDDDQPELDGDDGEPLPKTVRGMPIDTDDMDSEGGLLAHDVGPYKRNTLLTPKILKHLQQLGHKRVLSRSPIIGGSADGGVYAYDVGVNEDGVLPGRGSQAGLTAAQSLSEPVSQGQLGAKHSGGVAGQEKALSGFQAINQQIQVPKRIKGGAAHAEEDGRVQRIEKAPAGGHNVIVGGKAHYVANGFDLKVKVGDDVEAGDVISEGLPNHSLVVQHKGVGEGRRYFTYAYRQAMRDAGMKSNRRNVELLARGLINHVKLDDEWGDYVPDDVIPYVTVERNWRPREGHEYLPPLKANGMYLERPVLHYSVGTKVRPSVIKTLQEFGIKDVPVHKEPPPFQPHMVRGMANLQHDPDWMTRMYGSGLKSSLLDAVHHGAKSDARGTSFVPSLARAVDFGHTGGAVRQPEPGTRPPADGQPFGVKPPAPVAVQSQPEKKKPGWGSFFKLSCSRNWTKSAGLPQPPEPPKPPKPPEPKPSGNITDTPGGDSIPMPQQSGTFVGHGATSAAIAGKIGPGQNPNAFGSGYQGHGNAMTGGDAQGMLGATNVHQFAHGLDAEGYATLTGQNQRNGVVQRFNYAQAAPAGGLGGFPYMGPQQQQQQQQQPPPSYNPYAGQPAEQPTAPTQPSRYDTPAAAQAATGTAQPQPQTYGPTTAAQIMGWKAGHGEFDRVREALAGQKGVPVDQVAEADVSAAMYNQRRFELASQKGGFAPGKPGYERIKGDVVKDMLAGSGFTGSPQDALAQAKANAANYPAGTPEAKQYAVYLQQMEKLVTQGPDPDDVATYLKDKGMVDMNAVPDFDVTQNFRDQHHYDNRTTLGEVGETARAFTDPRWRATPLGLGVTVAPSAAWHAGGYKLYNMLPGVKQTQALMPGAKVVAKSPGLIKGVTNTITKAPVVGAAGKALGPAYMAYDVVQGLAKPHEEQLDRFKHKTQGKKDWTWGDLNPFNSLNPWGSETSAMADNWENFGDNVAAAVAGSRDAGEKFDDAGAKERRIKSLQAAQLQAKVHQHEQLSPEQQTPQAVAEYERNRAALRGMYAQQNNPNSAGNLLSAATGLQNQHAQLQPGDIEKAVGEQSRIKQDAEFTNDRAGWQQRLQAMQAQLDEQEAAFGKDPKAELPGSHLANVAWAQDAERRPEHRGVNPRRPDLWKDEQVRRELMSLHGSAHEKLQQNQPLSPTEEMALKLRAGFSVNRARQAARSSNLEDVWGGWQQVADDNYSYMPQAQREVYGKAQAELEAREQALWKEQVGDAAMPATIEERRKMYQERRR